MRLGKSDEDRETRKAGFETSEAAENSAPVPLGRRLWLPRCHPRDRCRDLVDFHPADLYTLVATGELSAWIAGPEMFVPRFYLKEPPMTMIANQNQEPDQAARIKLRKLEVKIPLPASLKAAPGTVKQKLARLRRQQNRG